MFHLKNRLGIQIIINQKEFPFDRVNALDFLHMCCSTRLDIPMLHFRVKDAAKFLVADQDLIDGAAIQINIVIRNQIQSFSFRLHTFKQIFDTTGPSYDIDAYLDSVSYWLATTSKAVSGSSNTVLSQIAQNCGISYYVGTTTADTQTWFPKNKRWREFARSLALHGYVDDQSCMVLGFDLDNKLIYKNLISKPTQKQAAVFITAKHAEGSFIATDYKIKNQSGFLNSVGGGYAGEIQVTSVMSTTQTSINTTQGTRTTSKFMINSEVYNEVKLQGRVSFRPIDGGNVHQNYEKAAYQNVRVSSLFSFGLELITTDVTGLNLLDYVGFVASVPEGKPVQAYSGNYFITSRTIYIQGLNYFEKLELCNQGLNGPVSGLL